MTSSQNLCQRWVESLMGWINEGSNQHIYLNTLQTGAVLDELKRHAAINLIFTERFFQNS